MTIALGALVADRRGDGGGDNFSFADQLHLRAMHDCAQRISYRSVNRAIIGSSVWDQYGECKRQHKAGAE